jgi:hypothetical protein
MVPVLGRGGLSGVSGPAPAGPLRGMYRDNHPGLPGLTSLLRLALVIISESPEPPVFRPRPVKGGVRVDSCVRLAQARDAASAAVPQFIG